MKWALYIKHLLFFGLPEWLSYLLPVPNPNPNPIFSYEGFSYNDVGEKLLGMEEVRKI